VWETSLKMHANYVTTRYIYCRIYIHSPRTRLVRARSSNAIVDSFM
jgi:hypothetical protein